MLNLLIFVTLLGIVAFGTLSVGGQGTDGTTELYLLSGPSAEEAVAADYPTATGSAPNQSLFVNVENHEGRSIQYTLVVARFHSLPPAGGTGTVLDQRRLTLAEGERAMVQYDGAIASEGQWLTVSVYRDAGTGGEPYRQLQLDLGTTEG